MACTYYSILKDDGNVICNEHANTSNVKAVAPLRSISKKSAKPELGVK